MISALRSLEFHWVKRVQEVCEQTTWHIFAAFSLVKCLERWILMELLLWTFGSFVWICCLREDGKRVLQAQFQAFLKNRPMIMGHTECCKHNPSFWTELSPQLLWFQRRCSCFKMDTCETTEQSTSCCQRRWAWWQRNGDNDWFTTDHDASFGVGMVFTDFAEMTYLSTILNSCLVGVEDSHSDNLGYQ